MILRLRWAWMLVLALLAGPAFALGLGQIEVKSQRDQPFLAEIPIVSSDPAELEQLQARLASPDTFARIGLEPPQGLVSNLQFIVGLDARGRPVIRVTSAEPVRQSLLTFLVEVDWGQGRLVREYSALVDAPRTVAAPVQPVIRAATVAPSSTVVLPRAPVAAAAPPAAAAPAPSPAPVAAEPAPPSPAVAPPPAPAVAARAALAAATPGEYGPVKAGETLGAIAGTVAPAGYTLDQTMLALLRGNPDAFVGGNLNLVRQGAVLRVPGADELARLDAAQAELMVRDQIAQWRQAQRPAPQPAAVAGDTAATAPAATRPATRNAPRVADARLEIVPPAPGSARRAGTRSGIDAGGEGDMLRQELQQTRETLAARDSEVDELKARLADLEKLQQQQAQLLSLKDSELAAAQQRLAASNQQAAAPAAVATQAAPAPAPDRAATWIWGGLALVALALVATWLARRRKVPAPPRAFSTSDLAAGMPGAGPPVAMADSGAVPPELDAPAPEDPVDAGLATAPAFVRAVPPAAPAAPASAPTWDASAAVMPTWHAGATPVSGDAAAAGDTLAAPADGEAPAIGGLERIELARAYIDLGDVDTARDLLHEVAAGGDGDARDEASRLLRELA